MGSRLGYPLHMRVCFLAVSSFALIVIGCPSQAEDEPPPTSDAGPDVSGSDTHGADGPISCAMACKRAPRCEEALTTELDCLKNCDEHTDYESSYEYACCIQYASGCAAVKDCIQGLGKCKPEGDPWVQLEMFAECACGDPSSPTPVGKECKSTSPDHPCPSPAICLKPPNDPNPAFCAIECTQNGPVCKEHGNLYCEVTPKFWYCKDP